MKMLLVCVLEVVLVVVVAQFKPGPEFADETVSRRVTIPLFKEENGTHVNVHVRYLGGPLADHHGLLRFNVKRGMFADQIVAQMPASLDVNHGRYCEPVFRGLLPGSRGLGDVVVAYRFDEAAP